MKTTALLLIAGIALLATGCASSVKKHYTAREPQAAYSGFVVVDRVDDVDDELDRLRALTTLVGRSTYEGFTPDTADLTELAREVGANHVIVSVHRPEFWFSFTTGPGPAPRPTSLIKVAFLGHTRPSQRSAY